MINIYDGNNYYRVLLETDHTGFAPRQVLHAMQNSKDINIWCWDGAKGNEARRQYYPEYKRNRTPLKKDIYVGFDLLKQVLSHTNVIQVEVPGYEADDVIAAITRHYAGRGEQVSIFSNDFDLHQLEHEFPNRVFTGARQKVSIPSRLVRHYKTLVGDPSDNIPGAKGFGQKTWESLSPELVEQLIYQLLSNQFEGMEQLPKAVNNWLLDEGNRFMLSQYWYIIGFMEISMVEISQEMKVGDGNFAAADSILKEFML